MSEVVPPERAARRAQREGREAGREGAPLRADGEEPASATAIEHTLTDHLQLERHGIADSMATEDLRRGVTAFKAGETPEFEGDEPSRAHPRLGARD